MVDKIKGCGADLLAWGSAKTTPAMDKIKLLTKKIERMNEEELTEESREEVLEASKKLDDFLLKQEIFWAQRSRVSWLKHGDRNTKFFHSKASQRRKRNFIHDIQNQHGNWVDDIGEMAEVAINYFETIFQSRTCDRMDECLNTVPQRITTDMKEELSRPYSVEEVKVALFHMGPTKVLGPNGMNALFYQKFWHIVGNDVSSAVLDFLNSGIMIPEINYTHIVLIPKVKSPEQKSFFCVQKSLLLCYPKQKLRGGFMGSKFAEGHLVFLICYLQMIL